MNFDSYFFPPVIRTDPALLADQNAAEREDRRRREDQIARLSERVSVIEEQLAHVESQKQIVRRRLTEAGRPPAHLAGVVQALLFLVAGGILYPLTLMPANTDDIVPIRKFIAIGLFVAGLIWIMIYLWILIQQSPRSDAEKHRDS